MTRSFRDYVRPGKYVYHHPLDGWYFAGQENGTIQPDYPQRTHWALRLWGVRHLRWCFAKAGAVTEAECMICHGILRGWR